MFVWVKDMNLKKLKKRMERISVEEYKKMAKKRKYNNTPVKYGGYIFDSKSECDEFLRLSSLQETGLISKLVVKPTYILTEKGTNDLGQKFRGVTYTPDFTYFDNLSMAKVAVDVKGFVTDVYKIKKKLFMAKYPDYLFVEVK